MQPKKAHTHAFWSERFHNGSVTDSEGSNRSLHEQTWLQKLWQIPARNTRPELRVLQHFHNFCRPSGSQDWRPIVYHSVSELHGYATSARWQFPVCSLWLVVADFSCTLSSGRLSTISTFFFPWLETLTLILFGWSVTALYAHPPPHSKQIRRKGNRRITLIRDWGLWWLFVWSLASVSNISFSVTGMSDPWALHDTIWEYLSVWRLTKCAPLLPKV